MIVQADENNFSELTKEGLVLVDFYTPFCGPCRLMNSTINEIEEVKIIKVDASENYKLVEQFNFTTVPTFIFMKDGVEVFRMKGLQTKDDLQSKIDELKNN